MTVSARVETVPIAYEDDRGEIRNIDAHVFGNVAIITSKAGSVRSNHYHRKSWHWLYVISGRMRYLESSLENDIKTETVIGPGQRVFTGPGIPHRTEFIEDTVLLSFAPTKTKQTHEDDLVRVAWP